MMPSVPNFKPSTSAFHFVNDWTDIPLRNISVGPVQVPIGSASNGLCGGMVFAVRDYFDDGVGIPNLTTNPTSDDELFRYIVDRLFDSFNLPSGPLRYLELMNPSLPDHETELSKLGLAPHDRAWRMIREEWPLIRADIDNGVVSPIALFFVKSLDPFQMGRNHVVLAYRYELNGNDLQIFVYDPNQPNNDNVSIRLNISDPLHTTEVSHNVNVATMNGVFGFFRLNYSFRRPPRVHIGPEPVRPEINVLHVVGITSYGRMWHTIRHPTYWDRFGDVEREAGELGFFALVGM